MSTLSAVHGAILAGALLLIPVTDAGSQVGAPEPAPPDRGAATTPARFELLDRATAERRVDAQAALERAIEDEETRDKVLAAFAAALLLSSQDAPGLH